MKNPVQPAQQQTTIMTLLAFTYPRPNRTIGSLIFAVGLSCALFGVADLQGSPTTDAYAFSLQAAGAFTVTPVSQTVVRDDQDLSITSALPFTLSSGIVTGFDDLTIPTFPARFFNGTFDWTAPDGDSVFGTLTIQTDVFTTPVTENFGGTFQFTGGTGQYLDATGGGVYSAQSDYVPPTIPGTVAAGFTTVSGTGEVTVAAPAPDSLGMMFLTPAALCLVHVRLRRRLKA